jgi:hypothetical protein
MVLGDDESAGEEEEQESAKEGGQRSKAAAKRRKARKRKGTAEAPDSPSMQDAEVPKPNPLGQFFAPLPSGTPTMRKVKKKVRQTRRNEQGFLVTTETEIEVEEPIPPEELARAAAHQATPSPPKATPPSKTMRKSPAAAASPQPSSQGSLFKYFAKA